jgi:hypothetical protein
MQVLAEGELLPEEIAFRQQRVELDLESLMSERTRTRTPASKRMPLKAPSAKDKARNPDLYFDIYQAERDFQQEEEEEEEVQTKESISEEEKLRLSKPRVRPMPARPVGWKEVGGKLFIGED